LELSKRLPGPDGYPLVGNGLALINKPPVELVKIIQSWISNYGDYFQLWLANDFTYYTHNPKDIEVILTSPKLIAKADEYDYMKPWLGTGLLIARSEKWHARRKVITPTFHFKILEQFVEVFDKQSNVFMEKLKKYSGQKAFDVFPLVTLCALDIICGEL
jgi:cytochrome P450 family 4